MGAFYIFCGDGTVFPPYILTMHKKHGIFFLKYVLNYRLFFKFAETKNSIWEVVQIDTQKKERILRIIIVILSVLLILSLTALAWMMLRPDASLSPSGVAPDNRIYSEAPQFRAASLLLSRTAVLARSSTALELYSGHGTDNTPFKSENMFPGDSETKKYMVQVSYTGSVTLHFHADIEPGYEKLAEVLEVSVRVGDDIIYEGLMGEMPSSVETPLSSGSDTTETVTYEITVSLDTSVGNEYQGKVLIADFRWWVPESEEPSPSPPDREPEPTPDPTPEPQPQPEPTPEPEPNPEPAPEPPEPAPDTGSEDSGHLIPKTGDSFRPALWISTAVLSLAVILLLTVFRRKEGRDEPK